MKIFNQKGKEVGYVTSGTFSPITKEAIGMAYVKKGNTKAGRKMTIQIRNKQVDAVVHKPPFMEPGYYRGA